MSEQNRIKVICSEIKSYCIRTLTKQADFANDRVSHQRYVQSGPLGARVFCCQSLGLLSRLLAIVLKVVEDDYIRMHTVLCKMYKSSIRVPVPPVQPAASCPARGIEPSPRCTFSAWAARAPFVRASRRWCRDPQAARTSGRCAG